MWQLSLDAVATGPSSVLIWLLLVNAAFVILKECVFSFNIAKAAFTSERQISTEDGLVATASRLNCHTSMSSAISEVVGNLDDTMFDPDSMVVVNYLTKAGAVTPTATAMTPANPTAVPPILASLNPVVNGPTVLCRPEIDFLTVTSTITKGPLRLTFQQTFGLEQGQQAVTRANGVIVTIHGYVGPDPITLTRDLFDQDIVQTAGHDVPCPIVAPAYGALNATLDDQTLYDTV